jgi:DNA-binding CsgD family transcriptional regulator
MATGATLVLRAADAVGQEAPDCRPWHPLTAREFSVANLVSTGKTNREIADELFLSPKTVSAHVEHILTKLGAGRRTEIAAWAARVDA